MRFARLSMALLCACFGISTLTGCGGGDGGGGSAVSTQTIASIRLSSSSTTLGTATPQQITATAQDQSGNTISGVTFTWVSSNSSVATVNNSGMASGFSAGSTNITASAQGVTSAALGLTVVESANVVTGTAATGAPISGAAVTLKDAQGLLRTATTDANGHFSIKTDSLSPPFMLRVQPVSGAALYSVSLQQGTNGVINVTPLTDLIVHSWYGVQGVEVSAAFDDVMGHPAPSPEALELMRKVISSTMENWLIAASIDTSTFNFISTPFSANHSGIDGVLDKLTADMTKGTLTVTDGATTQQTTLIFGTSPPTVTVKNSVSGARGASSTYTSTVVPTQAAQQAALEGVNATMAEVVKVAKLAKAAHDAGEYFDASAFSPYFSNDFLDGGLPADYAVGFMEDELKLYDVAFRLHAIDSMDDAAGRVTATFDRIQTEDSVSRTEQVQYTFKKVGDQWLFYGNQRPADLGVRTEMRTYAGAVTSGSGPYIRAQMNTASLSVNEPSPVQSGTVTGGGAWDNAPLLQVDSEWILDKYVAEKPLSTPVVAGTPVTFNLIVSPNGTPSSIAYELRTRAFTSEAISITNLTGTTLTDAQLGNPRNVQWTLPKSYVIQSVKLMAITTGSYGTYTDLCEVPGPLLAATATSGTLTIPTWCGNASTVAADVYVIVEGVNGERSVAIYSFK